MTDLNVTESGLFAVTEIKNGGTHAAGTYQNVTLKASSSGSIHVLDTLIVLGTLTIEADHSATILLPAKVSCSTLILKSKLASNVNSNDLEVDGKATITVEQSATASLYMVINSGNLAGWVTDGSTFNCWLHTPKGVSTNDTIQVDHSSSSSRIGWKGPS